MQIRIFLSNLFSSFIKLNLSFMLIRKILACKAIGKNAYPFAVDAKSLTIGVPKEVYEDEKRVSTTPETVERVIKKNGSTFLVESGAGLGASIPDEKYIAAGAKIVSAKEALQADVVLKVRAPQFNPTIQQDET